MFKQKKTSQAVVMALASSLLTLPVQNAFSQENDEVERVEKIQVVGSRISRDSSLDSPSPVLTIGADDIKTSGVIDIGELLRESPQLQNSLAGSFSAFNDEPLGASQLDLRNLGTERTLVLENGRRHVAGIEGTGTVDVNTISTALLESVEILTGGASALYGADAVSGAVNFNLRSASSFDGAEIRTQTGITDDGDGEEFFLSIANGAVTEDGRGEIVFAVEYNKTKSILAGDRDFAGSGLSSQISNSAAISQAFGIDPRFSNVFVPNQTLPISSGAGVISLTGSSFVSVFLSGGVPGCSFLGAAQIPECQVVGADGVLRAYNPGIFSGPFEASGGDGIATNPDDEILLPDSERILLQTIGKYDVSDYARLFVDAKYVTTRTQESDQVNGFNDDIPIALDNPYIPTELLGQIATLQAEGLSPSLVVSRDVVDLAARSNPDAERSTARIVVGVEGVIPKLDFDYEISYNYGRTDADITSRERLEDRYFAAIDAVVDPNTGDIVCRSELDPTALPPTSPFPVVNGNFGFITFQPGSGACVPINILGANSISQEGADFIFQPGTEVNEIEQENIVVVVSGDLGNYFELPAGPIGFATGYEYRREESSFQPDAFSALGLTFATLDSQAGPTNPSSGTYSVEEYFVELEIPILEGKFLAESLDINGAYRTSNYDAFESTDTWTVGSIWQPVESLSVRTTYSEAVRVPNIGEAFAPQFAETIGATQDPCNQNFIDSGTEFREANCIALIGQTVADGTYDSTNFLSAFVSGVSGGNPDLNPEEAETLTVGLVYRPTTDFGGVLDGLIVTLDYYSIEIDGLIDSLTGFQIAQNCVDLPSIDNQFCAAIDRDATNGFITDFRSGLINLGSVETEGLDFRVDYGFDIATSRIDLGINGTRFLTYDEVRDPSAPDEVVDVLEEFNNPEWIVNFTADYSIGDFTFGWQGRYESSQLLPGLVHANFEGEGGADFINVSETGSAFVHDFTVNYDYSDKIGIFGGVNNAFEKDPFLGALSRPAGPRGRYFFVGVNLSL